MKFREAREVLLSGLREKPEGLTRKEVQGLFPGLKWETVDRILLRYYHRYLVGYDCVTDPRQARWIA